MVLPVLYVDKSLGMSITKVRAVWWSVMNL